ncbi:CDP-diacylglycerol--glycerol-3-phosphate 3-phosphatidyltransferase [Balneolales bacterium ANBcel1]|nr:CDP-diacylglycerol--glycerol-3-phosphate 3-phosphatidyltransferase [Balneolales bacterium ANBcel1]
MKRIPNILSLLRILLAPLFVYLYLQDAFFWAALGMVVFIVAAITDYLDGYLARRLKVSSSLGMFLDPLADKILTFAGFICLPLIDPAQFPWWIIAVIVVRDIAITSLRVWADYRGVVMETRSLAKAKTMVQMIFLYTALLTALLAKAGGFVGDTATYFLNLGLLGWLFIFVMVFTVYTALEYLYINRKLFRRATTKI